VKTTVGLLSNVSSPPPSSSAARKIDRLESDRPRDALGDVEAVPRENDLKHLMKLRVVYDCSKRSLTAARTSRTSSKALCSRIPDGRGHLPAS